MADTEKTLSHSVLETIDQVDHETSNEELLKIYKTWSKTYDTVR